MARHWTWSCRDQTWQFGMIGFVLFSISWAALAEAEPVPPGQWLSRVREDGRCCGGFWEAPNGGVAECDPNGAFPCCSVFNWCGATTSHCECSACVDYRQVGLQPEPELSRVRDDGQCGGDWLAPNGEVAQCDRDGAYPCCSSHHWCGGTPLYCECVGCIDYRRTVGLQPEPELSRVRDDGQCGGDWLAPNGEVAECDRDGAYPCCSSHHWCGGTPLYCECVGCIDYRRTVDLQPEPELSRVRDDGQCGGDWLAPNGEVAECDPNGAYPCCSSHHWCGGTPLYCQCEGCIDYSRTVDLQPEPELSRVRDDGQCGGDWLAPNGEVAECDPDGAYPCCSSHNWCGGTSLYCECEGCIDYRTDADCEEIAIAQCKAVSYDMTQFPNALGQQTQHEVEDSFESFLALMWYQDCPVEFFKYVCHLYVPPCESTGIPRTPCKELCEAGLGGCFANAKSRGVDPAVDVETACESLPLASSGTCFAGFNSTSPVETDSPSLGDGVGDVGACEDIVVSDCKNMPYTETQFPNQIGDQSQAEVEETYGYIFTIMREVGCPSEFFQYMCLLSVPPCVSTGIPSVPCRELCLAGVGGCFEIASSQAFDIPFNTSICEALPSAGSGKCFDGTISPPAPGPSTTEQPEPTEEPRPPPAVRLANGDENYGRVEVLVEGEWGSVCDYEWEIQDAEVVCRELGFPGASSAPLGSRFLGSNLTILLDTVACTGEEASLLNCSASRSPGWWCDHDAEASVICFLPDGTTGVPEYGHVRLAGGNDTSGTVEVYTRDTSNPGIEWPQWGTVCDDGWDIADADVVCRQLGFPGALTATVGSLFGEGNGVSLISYVSCSGTEESIVHCSPEQSSCPEGRAAGVICLPRPNAASPSGITIRLVGGDATSGRVEVYFDDSWNTVCDADWDMTDATVACRALGFVGAISIQKGAYYGEGDGPEIIDHLLCKGSEPSPLACEQVFSGECDHSQDSGVVCSHGDGPKSLWYRNDGRCGGDWLAANGEVAECDATGDFPCCSASNWCENQLSGCDCPTCVDFRLDYGAVRLYSKDNDTAGTLEVYLRDLSRPDGARPRWGSVCDEGWDLVDADVACRSLGFPGALSAPRGGHFSRWNRDPLISDVNCLGIEDNIAGCSSDPPRCAKEDAAGVVCRPPPIAGGGRVRLADGNETAGRVELFIDGNWGTLCDSTWGMGTARLVCRDLGFDGALSIQDGAYYGEGTGPINIDHPNCRTPWGTLLPCITSATGRRCDHSNDAGVVCDPGSGGGVIDTCEEVTVNICKFMQYEETQFPNQIGQQTQAEAVEAFDRLWPAIKDSGCPIEFFQYICLRSVPPCESDVVSETPCKELCLAAVGECLDIARSQGFDLPVNESACASLPSESTGTCFARTIHSSPVEGDLRIVGSSSDMGRIEVFLDGRWGSVCRRGFDFSPDGDVPCRQLGFDSIIALWYTGSPGPSSLPINMADVVCDGSEERLIDCAYSKATGCSHSEDVTITCD